MSQTSYKLNHDVAYAGLQADSGFDYNVSRVAEGDLGFGIGAVAGTDAAEQVRLPLFDIATLTYDADFVASNVINVSVNGAAISPVTYATSHAVTLAAVVSAIDGLTGVDATNTSGRIIEITADGTDVAVVTTVTSGSSQAGHTIVTSSSDVVRGITVCFLNQETGQVDDTNVATIKRRGAIWCKTDGSGVTVDGNVYINTDGEFTDSATDSLAVSSASYVDYDSVTELAKVEINLP